MSRVLTDLLAIHNNYYLQSEKRTNIFIIGKTKEKKIQLKVDRDIVKSALIKLFHTFHISIVTDNFFFVIKRCFFFSIEIVINQNRSDEIGSSDRIHTS